ncbi:MAG: MBL fold metallo-hydrolase [Firmicutes bacterium]|nr:MBL fold metallo-hydrolase [Bacillota bacterium]
MKKLTTPAAWGLGLALPAALAWYYDVYVHWQPKLYPFAMAAVSVGVVLLTLLTLHTRGERKALCYVWKAALSLAVFVGGILLGIPLLVKEAFGRSTEQAAAVAIPLAAAQVIVLFALLLRGKGKRKAGTALLAAGLAIAALGGAALWNLGGMTARYYRTRVLTTEGLASYEAVPGQTAIHFLNVSGDAILLESGGKFALIDAGEDSDDPTGNPDLAYAGYEDYVLDYVKRATGGRLDFILGTHAHSDHLGGFDTLLADPDVAVGRAYLKRYHEHERFKYDYEYDWDNQEVYDQTLNALHTRGVPLIQDIPAEPFALGEFTLTFFNGEYDSAPWDENDNSICLLAEVFGQRVFLGGDLNDYGGKETRLAPQIGKVDLLKAMHHGGEHSNTEAILSVLQPRTVIITNREIDLTDKWFLGPMRRFHQIAKAERIMCTGGFGGIVAVFGEDGIAYFACG